MNDPFHQQQLHHPHGLMMNGVNQQMPNMGVGGQPGSNNQINQMSMGRPGPNQRMGFQQQGIGGPGFPQLPNNMGQMGGGMMQGMMGQGNVGVGNLQNVSAGGGGGHPNNQMLNQMGYNNQGYGSQGISPMGVLGPSPPRFDMNDFPALGDSASSPQDMSQKSGGSQVQQQQQPQQSQQPQILQHHQQQHSIHHPSHGQIPSHIHPQHQYSIQQRQQPQNSRPEDFAIANEDFPALGGGRTDSRHVGSAVPGASKSLGVGGVAQSAGTSQQLGASSNISTGQAGSNQTQSASSDSKYALKGLLSVIRMTHPDLNTLALGTDLTTLGLNLNSSDVLYATFAYPSLDAPTRRDPDFVLPYCYYMQPPALKTSHLSKFQLETLFYIFYNMPKDTLQVYAAKELYNRDWRYHKELKLWFTRDAGKDPQVHVPPGGYICFDVNAWERRLYTNAPQGLVFMAEEELEG